MFVGTVLFAQEDSTEMVASFYPPDFDKIKVDCQNKKSDLFYPKLVKRFEKGDTTLGLQELQTFYYGQVFQKDYSPYTTYPEFDQILSLINKESEPEKTDVLSIISLADKVIKRSPTEPKSYYYKFLAQNVLCEKFGGDTVELNKTRLQFQMLFYTISYSGNGSTKEVPMYVTAVSHEYLMMNMYGFRAHQQSLVQEDGHSYDMFQIDSNEYGVEELWFNIDPIISTWDKLFGNKEVKKTDEKVTTIDIDLGSYFVIKLDKTKRKNSKFHLVETKRIEDTLVADKEKLFTKEIPEDCIVGYFCPMRLSETSDHVSNNLVFISNSKKEMLYFDTEMLIKGGDCFRSTSNSGMIRGCMMDEMWNDPIVTLKISNIRTKE